MLSTAKDINFRKEIFFISIAIVHFLILFLFLSHYFDAFFNDARHRLGLGTDFAAIYNGGKFWLQDGNPYGHGPGFGFRYHPALAFVIGHIFLKTSFNAAFGILILIQEIAFWTIVRLFFIRLSYSKPFIVFTILLTFFTPYYLDVYMGNLSFIVTCILLAAFHFLEAKKNLLFSGLLTISIIVKPIGLVFLPLMLIRKLYIEVFAVVVAVAGLAFPFFFDNPGSLKTFISINLEAIPNPGWVINAGNQGFHGLVVTLLTRLSNIPTQKLATFNELPFPGNKIVIFLPIAFFIASLYANFKSNKFLYVGIFLWSMTYLLGYKDVWEHSYAFAILPLFYLYESKIVNSKILFLASLIIALPTAFVFYDVPLPSGPVDPEHVWGFSISMLHHCTKSIPIFLLYVYVIASISGIKKADLCEARFLRTNNV